MVIQVLGEINSRADVSLVGSETFGPGGRRKVAVSQLIAVHALVVRGRENEVFARGEKEDSNTQIAIAAQKSRYNVPSASQILTPSSS